jgi:hypothetical protein
MTTFSWTKLALLMNTEFRRMSTFFQGITKTVPSLFTEFFRNEISMATLNSECDTNPLPLFLYLFSSPISNSIFLPHPNTFLLFFSVYPTAVYNLLPSRRSFIILSLISVTIPLFIDPHRFLIPLPYFLKHLLLPKFNLTLKLNLDQGLYITH